MQSRMQWQSILSAVVIFGIVGFAGSLPASLMAAIFFGGAVGGDVLLLGTLLLGSWLPLTLLVNPAVESNLLSSLTPRSFSPLVILLSSVAFLLLIPVLWTMTAPAFLVTLMGYILTDQNLLLSILIAAVAQGTFLYVNRQRGGLQSNLQVLTRVETMQDNFNVETVTLSGDDVSVRAETSGNDDTASNDSDDEPKVRYLTDGDDSIDIPPPDESRTTRDNDSRTAD